LSVVRSTSGSKISEYAIIWPVLEIGLLSDDFVLAAHALDWSLGPVTSALE